MYLWNTKALINALQNDQVTQKEQLKYFLLGGILQIAIPHEVNVYTVVNIVIFIIGVFLCYNANIKGDNKDFIVRMACLTFPISIRLFLPTLISMIMDMVVFHIFFSKDYITEIFPSLFFAHQARLNKLPCLL